jgi:predicted DNA-binding transcriptional regulator YafY
MTEHGDPRLMSDGELERAVNESLAAFDASGPTPNTSREVRFTYTNWRGETAERHVTPLDVAFRATEWHPRLQWLLRATDHDKQAIREFAICNISNWRPVGG